jgi:hypothetical protein
MQPNRLLLYVSLFVLLGVSSGMAHQQSEQLGQVHFAVSCSTAAQPQFDRAVALLHSFWYSEAVKAFTAVTATDPDCAMGYWGIAMSLWYPLWQPPSEAMLKKGADAVTQAQAIGGKSEREQAYIAAIAAFYQDWQTRDHRTRALAYEQAMERLAARYPDDREGAIFYALALNATAPTADKTYTNQLKATAILEKIFIEEPNHPGVAHYLIHSYDYPALASRGLPAARRYAQIAPSSSHALHMPSHIFTRQGLWQESIATNVDSAAAAKTHNSVFEELHALDYLAYAYLQSAQDVAAQGVLDERNALAQADLSNFAAAYAFAAIPARYTLERRRWSEAAVLEPYPSKVTYSEAITYFARALGAARSGDAESARPNVDKLQSLAAMLHDAKQAYWAEQVDIQHRVAQAWLAHAEGKPEEALTLMRTAVEMEDATEKHPVTPGPIMPARELLGDLLLELHDPAHALQEFEASMQKEPNRFNGLYGAARAAELAGEKDKAKSYYDQVVALCAHSDTARPELQQAKAFLTKQ